VAAGGPETERTASELEWLRVSAYLGRHRHGLAVRAAAGYPSGARVAGTPLLAAPSWLPREPVPLGRIRLSLRPGAPPPRVSGTAGTVPAGTVPAGAVPAGTGPALLPSRPDGTRYRRYCDVVAELAPPAIFENRTAYRLIKADLAGEDPRLDFGLCRYFDVVDAGGAAAWEYAAAELGPAPAPGLREAIGDPRDLTARPAAMAVCALTLRYDRAAGTASFPLHYRDPARVGHAGGMYQVIPVGIFQPSGEAPWNLRNDFSLWRCMLREFAEELLGAAEDHGSEASPIGYESWPLARRMTQALDSGQIRAWCLGLGTDALTFAVDLLTVVVIDAPLYDDLFGAVVPGNAEGTVLGRRPFDSASVAALTGGCPVQAAGAALLRLALARRDVLLA
jgi:hypothetical protein